MDTAEHNILFDFVKEQRVFNTEQKEFNKAILDEVQDLSRGLYGDKKNGTPGLVQRQEIDEIRITKLEGFRNKLLWFTSGSIVAGQAVWEVIKAKMIK